MPDETMIAADVGTDVGDVSVETPEITGTETETTDQQVEQKTDQQETPKVGRPALDPIKNAFEKLKAADPRAAADLRKSYYSLQQQITEAKELLELHGGEDGIANLKQEAEEYASTLSKVAQGDPAVLDEVIADSREGFLKLASASIDKMRVLDPVAYDRTLAPHLLSTLERTGVSQTFDVVAQFIRAGDGQGALEAISKAIEWRDQLGKFAKENQQKTADNDPREMQLKTEKESIAKEKAEFYQGQINAAVTSTINTDLSKHLTPLLKGKTLTPQQKQGIVSDAYTEIAKTIRAQERTQAQIAAFRKQNKPAEEIARFLSSKITARDAEGRSLASRAVNTAWQGRGFGSAPSRTAGQPTGVQNVTKPPESSTIDWTKDRSRERHMSGEATLKNGRIVKWNWADVQ